MNLINGKGTLCMRLSKLRPNMRSFSHKSMISQSGRPSRTCKMTKEQGSTVSLPLVYVKGSGRSLRLEWMQCWTMMLQRLTQKESVRLTERNLCLPGWLWVHQEHRLRRRGMWHLPMLGRFLIIMKNTEPGNDVFDSRCQGMLGQGIQSQVQ